MADQGRRANACAVATGTSRLGYIWIGAQGSDGETLRGIRQGLADIGLIDGRTMTFEARYAEGRPERLPELAEDLLRRNVALLIVPGMVATRAIAEVVKTVPIVSATSRRSDCDRGCPRAWRAQAAT